MLRPHHQRRRCQRRRSGGRRRSAPSWPLMCIRPFGVLYWCYVDEGFRVPSYVTASPPHRRWNSITSRIALLVVLLVSPCAVRGQLAVVWNEGVPAGGRLDVAGTRSPWSARQTRRVVGSDAVLGRAAHGQLFALSRSAGTVTLFTVRGAVRRRFDLGAESELEDMVGAGPCSAYITRRNATRLLHLDLCTGATRESVDLSGWADPDGNPDLGSMLIDDGRLFVQVRRYNQDVAGGFVSPAYLAVVDLATEQLVDVDPARPAVQAIELVGTSPKHRMQVVDATRRLFVGATGGFFDDGGIEAIDLATLRSAGLVLREADGTAGADIGPFIMITPERGYLVFSTDLTLSSHLHGFSLSGGVDPEELNVSVDYAVPALAHDPVAGTLFLPDGVVNRQGLHVFDAASGLRLSNKPIPTGGPPTDVLLLRRFQRPRP